MVPPEYIIICKVRYPFFLGKRKGRSLGKGDQPNSIIYTRMSYVQEWSQRTPPFSHPFTPA